MYRLYFIALDCKTPSNAGTVAALKQSCKKQGGTPQCCTVPAAQQGVLCVKPAGA